MIIVLYTLAEYIIILHTNNMYIEKFTFRIKFAGPENNVRKVRSFIIKYDIQS